MIKNSLQRDCTLSRLIVEDQVADSIRENKLNRLKLSPVMTQQRQEWLEESDQINQRITRIETELEKIAEFVFSLGL